MIDPLLSILSPQSWHQAYAMDHQEVVGCWLLSLLHIPGPTSHDGFGEGPTVLSNLWLLWWQDLSTAV